MLNTPFDIMYIYNLYIFSFLLPHKFEAEFECLCFSDGDCFLPQDDHWIALGNINKRYYHTLLYSVFDSILGYDFLLPYIIAAGSPIFEPYYTYDF